MGKLPYMYTDSEETEDTCSSVENLKKKKKFSILGYTNGNVKKKKCKVHSVSEPDESESRTRNNQRVRKLRGILKHDRDRESSDEDEYVEPAPVRPRDKYLVGSVPRVAGSRPGRGGGVAILVRKNTLKDGECFVVFSSGDESQRNSPKGSPDLKFNKGLFSLKIVTAAAASRKETVPRVSSDLDWTKDIRTWKVSLERQAYRQQHEPPMRIQGMPNMQSLQAQSSNSSTKRGKLMKRIARKRSY